MAEYIKRDVVMNGIMGAKWMDGYDGAMAMEIAASAPAADVAPVTRCKDCKYAYINSFAVSSGEALCTLSGKPMQQDDFCSYGEPKEG